MSEVEGLLNTIKSRIAKYKEKKRNYSNSLKFAVILLTCLGAVSTLTSVLNLAIDNSIIKDIFLVITTILITFVSSVMGAFEVQEKIAVMTISLENYTYLANLVECVRIKLERSEYLSTDLFADLVRDLVNHFTQRDIETIEISEYVNAVRRQTSGKVDLKKKKCPSVEFFPQIMEITSLALSYFHVFIYDHMVQVCGESGLPSFDLKHIQELDLCDETYNFLEMDGKFYCFEVRIFSDSDMKSYYIIMFAEVAEEVFAKLKSEFAASREKLSDELMEIVLG